MFERYTEKARRVIFFARYEASQFGSPVIDPEHLLLGLLREDKALTNRFLRSQSSVDSIRKEIEGRTTVRELIATSVDLPLANDCKRILAYAAEEAERLAHKHIGTEHLLLGILREKDCFAAKLLEDCGLRPEAVREELSEGPIEGSARPVQGIGSRAGGTKPIPIVFLLADGAVVLRHENHLFLPLPRVGDSVSLNEPEQPPQRYRVLEVNWHYAVARRGTVVPEEVDNVRKSLESIKELMESAIANHEFEKARFYSEQERKERDNLRTLSEKHGYAGTPSPTADAGALPSLREVVVTLAAEAAAGA